MSTLRAWRVHEIAGCVPALAWASFHLWEQWPAFAGRDAFTERMIRTSHGGLAVVAELALGILPALVWLVLDVALRARGDEPEALRSAMAEHPEAALRLGLLARVCGWIFAGWLFYHAAWLWLPKLTQGSEPLRTWGMLRDELGRTSHAVAHALGLTAFAGHVWASFPRLAIAFGWAGSAEARRAARLSGFIVACGMLLLYAQLAGWHAAGRGTIWSGGSE